MIDAGGSDSSDFSGDDVGKGSDGDDYDARTAADDAAAASQMSSLSRREVGIGGFSSRARRGRADVGEASLYLSLGLLVLALSRSRLHISGVSQI